MLSGGKFDCGYTNKHADARSSCVCAVIGKTADHVIVSSYVVTHAREVPVSTGPPKRPLHYINDNITKSQKNTQHSDVGFG